MQELERKNNGLFLQDRPFCLIKKTGTIDAVMEKPESTTVYITCGLLKDTHTGFTIPKEHKEYFREMLGLKPETKLEGTQIYLHTSITGWQLYGISPFKR
jgi:hypothetical protein